MLNLKIEGNKMGKKRKGHIERICNNCKLYNPQENHCSVVVLHEGERLHLPVEPSGTCFYEEDYFDPNTKAMENFTDDLKEIKFWVENEKGEKVDGDGIVKVECPTELFVDDQKPSTAHDTGSFTGP